MSFTGNQVNRKGRNTQSEIMPTLESEESRGALPCVLLVDDNEAMLMGAAGVLKASCAIVGAVTNGSAGIDAAATLQPDVIVLDVSMPGMNGFEVASSPGEAGSTAALIFFTVYQEQDVVPAALARKGARLRHEAAYVHGPRARRPRSSAPGVDSSHLSAKSPGGTYRPDDIEKFKRAPG